MSTLSQLSLFLEAFRRQEALIFGFKNVIIPKKVVVDRSLVLLQTFLKVFNLETVSDYAHRCFRIVNGSGKEEDFNKMFIYACVNHVMNSARMMCRKIL